MVPSIILTSHHWRWSLPSSHWWLNRRDFLNEDTLRPQRGICCNPICTPEDSEDVCWPQCVRVEEGVGGWRGGVMVTVDLLWDYFWVSCLHLTAVTVQDDGGKLAFPLGARCTCDYPTEEEDCLWSVRTFLHTCMHVRALRRGFR